MRLLVLRGPAASEAGLGEGGAEAGEEDGVPGSVEGFVEAGKGEEVRLVLALFGLLELGMWLGLLVALGVVLLPTAPIQSMFTAMTMGPGSGSGIGCDMEWLVAKDVPRLTSRPEMSAGLKWFVELELWRR